MKNGNNSLNLLPITFIACSNGMFSNFGHTKYPRVQKLGIRKTQHKKTQHKKTQHKNSTHLINFS